MKAQNHPSLEGLDDDTLIYIFSFLTIDEILTARKVSSRLAATSRQFIVWRHALDSQIFAKGFPFPDTPFEGLTALQLEHAMLRAHRLARFWLRPARVPRVLAEFCPRSGTSLSVSDVRLVPAHPGTLVVVSRVIWDTLVLWDVSVPKGDSSAVATPVRLAEWSRKGALFTGLAVNTDPRAEACLAVSMNFSGDQRIELLAIRRDETGLVRFETVAAIPSTFRVMTLQGDIVALSDDVNETHLQNWRTGKCAVLCGSDAPSEHNFRHNRCMQVLLTPHCVAIVRARSFETFRTPPLVAPEDIAEPHRPFGQHAFGWIDGVAVTPRKILPSHKAKSDEDTPDAPPLSILLRTESDDPWADDLHTVDLYVLRPTTHREPSYPFDITLDAFGNILASGPKNIDADIDINSLPQKTSIDPYTIDSAQEAEPTAPEEDPYTFPPLHVSAYPGTRGHLHCRDMRLGAHGTALWIQPRPAHATASRGLTAFDVHSSATQEPGPGSSTFVEGRESLVAAVTAGVMRENNVVEFGEGVSVRTLRALDSGEGNWTCLDYDEARGIVALGSSHGRVTLLSLE